MVRISVLNDTLSTCAIDSYPHDVSVTVARVATSTFTSDAVIVLGSLD